MSGIIKRGYRKIVREILKVRRKGIARRVLATRPSPPAAQGLPFTVHSLLCRRDLVMGICSAKSLNLAAGVALPWVFHDDGSLRSGDVALLAHHFPGSRVVTRAEADRQLAQHLAPYPETARARQQYVMMLKLVDLYYFSDRERVLYVDSDILFFKNPAQLLDHRAGHAFNRDFQSHYLYPEPDLRRFTGIDVKGSINAGLSSLDRSNLHPAGVEALLRAIPLREGLIYHRIEQTLVALLASSPQSRGVDYLAAPYDVSLTKPVPGAVCKHYVGAIRAQFELEGLRFLLNEMNFTGRWEAFAAGR